MRNRAMSNVVLAGFYLLFCASTFALQDYYFSDDFSELSIEGADSELVAKGVYLSGRGRHLDVVNGGRLLCDKMKSYGNATQGVVYSELLNGVNVYGAGSMLCATNEISLSSYYCPGAPGLSLDLAREIPTFLQVSSGGEVWIGDTLTVANSSWASVGAGGRLSIGTGCSSANALEIAPDGTLDIRLGGYEHDTTGWPDRLSVMGDADLDGVLRLTLEYGFSPTNGACFDLFDWGGAVNGQFSATAFPALADGLEWDCSGLYTTGQVSVIPEPSVLHLFVLFGAGILIKHQHLRS
ncbi:MAG: hypothetical protein JXR25_09215 [Pontiellaceae bacterium]|nr:hypothetical protein [Pontiellaceae bacterium]MBN2784995.1 hypothetical protein [Pontiellaceae bacterium]